MLLTAILIVSINVLLQAAGTILWLRKVAPVFKPGQGMLSNLKAFYFLTYSVIYFTLLHTVQAALWSVAFYFLPATAPQFSSFLEALYFSFVTFTTLGYGDIYLHSNWRILSGIEAINGIIMIGWSTALMYSLVQHLFKSFQKDTTTQATPKGDQV